MFLKTGQSAYESPYSFNWTKLQLPWCSESNIHNPQKLMSHSHPKSAWIIGKGCICYMMSCHVSFINIILGILLLRESKSSLHSCVGKSIPRIICTRLTIPLRGPHRNTQSFHFIQRFQTAPGYCWPTLCKIIFEWIQWSPGACVLLELKISSSYITQHLICCF